MSLCWECVCYRDDDQRVVFVEIMPSEGHVSSPDCWCGPELFQYCDECDPEDETCWKCGGESLVDYDETSPHPPVAMHYDNRIP